MINSKLDDVKTLNKFNSEIRRQQEEAHGKDYCAIHDAIKKYLNECNSYMELGVHQGGTASIAMLSKPKFIQLVDIDMSKYNKVLGPLAEKYCENNNVQLVVKECDSRGLSAMVNVDMLVIDSYHFAPFMKAELDMHGNNVNKYIIAHDTSVINGKPDTSLYDTLNDFATNNGWEVIERNTDNVGYTVLKRK